MWGDFLSVRQKIWIKALYWQIVRDTRIISSTWTKEGCKKGIYYTTQVTYWNLLRITTANAIIRYHIFHLFVGRHKKRIPVMERYCRLNMKIEGHIANLYYLFWHFKNMLPYFTIQKYFSFFFLLSDGKQLILSWKRRQFCWSHSPSCLVKYLWYHYELYFAAIGMWYSRLKIMTMEAPVP